MKAKSLLILIILLFFNTLSYTQKSLEARRHYKEILKDATENPLDFYLFDSNSQTFYFLSNNKDSLFVNLKFQDEQVQKRVLQSGLTLYFDFRKKFKKENSIQFPVQSNQPKEKKGGPPGKNEPGNSIGMLKEMCLEKNELWITGFDEPQDEEIIVPADNPDGISGYLRFSDKDELLYQVAIPFEKIPEYSSGERGPFSFMIESGSMEGDDRQSEASPRMGGNGSMGMGTPPGGGSMPSGMSPSGGGMQPPGGQGQGMPEKTPDAGSKSNPIKIKIKKVTVSKTE